MRYLIHRRLPSPRSLNETGGAGSGTHPVIEDLGEVLEAEALPSSPLVGKPLRLAKIPKGIAVGGVLRDGRAYAVTR